MQTVRNRKRGAPLSASDVDCNAIVNNYYTIFSANFMYSYASGKFKLTGLILLSLDGRGNARIRDGRTEYYY
jgi:hypothetical protein